MVNVFKKPSYDELSGITTQASLHRTYMSSYTQSQVVGIQTAMNDLIAAHRVPLDRYFHEQDPRTWKRFCDDFCRKKPTLLSYEDAWPAQVLFDIKVRRHRKIACLDQLPSSSSGRGQRGRDSSPPPANQRALRTQTTRTGASRFSPYPMAATPPSRGNGTSYIIDLTRPSPPPRSMSPSSIEVECGSPRPLSIEERDIPHVGQCKSPFMHHPEGLVFPQNSQVSFTSSQATVVETLNIPSSSPLAEGTEPLSPDELFVGCCECGHPVPPHLTGSNLQLTALLEGECVDTTECLRALYDRGLTSDAHLNLFLEWPIPCRKAFIGNTGVNKNVRRNLRALVHATSPAEEKGKGKARCEPIPPLSPLTGRKPCTKVPQPANAEAEDTITDPQMPLELLLRAMNLPDNQGPFRKIVTAVKDGADPYMMTLHPSQELFGAAVKDVTRKNIHLFERYENQWPARVILKRLAREYKIVPSDDHLSPLASSSPSSSIPPSTFWPQRVQQNRSNGSPAPSPKADPASRSPGVRVPKISYTCPIHPGPDQAFVEPIVQERLHFCGLTELIPVFALMGMSAEEHLREFCELSVVRKDKVLSAAGLKLNAFQELALKLELWEGVLAPVPPS